jgi:RNA polymerase sigma-70 factor (ECF subfamily)
VTPSDAELIARVLLSDDHAAFGDLLRRHQSAVRHFLRHLTHGDAALADDLAQETFIGAYRGLTRYSGAAKFSTWLLGIAHNHWRNARRRRQPVALEAGQLDSLEPTPATAAASDLRHDLALALGQLAPEEQTALHLHYHQGLTHSEIADVLDWPLGTVKTHLARSKEKLRPLLASWNPQI